MYQDLRYTTWVKTSDDKNTNTVDYFRHKGVQMEKEKNHKNQVTRWLEKLIIIIPWEIA